MIIFNCKCFKTNNGLMSNFHITLQYTEQTKSRSQIVYKSSAKYWKKINLVDFHLHDAFYVKQVKLREY